MTPRALLVLSILVVLAAGCARRPAPGPMTRNLSPELVFTDNSGGIRDSMHVVIRDLETWRRLWADATATQEQALPLPMMDFGREMGILVSAGRMTIEDRIRVDNAVVHGATGEHGRWEEALEVEVLIRQGCGRFQRDGYPLEIVRVQRFDGPATFTVRRERDPDC